MTSNCPKHSLEDRPVSSFFSATAVLLPGLAVHTAQPVSPVRTALALIDLGELEIACRRPGGRRSVEDFLSPEEKKRLAAYTYPKRRNEWLGGRLAGKICVLELLRQPKALRLLAAISILPTEHGIPRAFASLALPHSLPAVSISHSGRYAAAMATAHAACGIDIQEVSARIIGVADRFAGPEEVQILRDAVPEGEEARRLTLLWAAKEALKKSLLSDRPVLFRGMLLQSISSCSGFILRFACPAGADRPVDIATASLDGYMLAHTAIPNPHA